MFHFLKTLVLPNFTLDGWHSSIRNRIGVLSSTNFPQYADLQNINSSGEESDLIFTASPSLLTTTLRSHLIGGLPAGFDQEDPEQDIEYYFEVKTTPGKSTRAFFMSNKQYKRMEEMAYVGPISHDRGGAAKRGEKKKLYVIVRVYGLTASGGDGVGDGLGMSLLVDPWREEISGRNQGKLKFGQLGWRVELMKDQENGNGNAGDVGTGVDVGDDVEDDDTGGSDDDDIDEGGDDDVDDSTYQDISSGIDDDEDEPDNTDTTGDAHTDQQRSKGRTANTDTNHNGNDHGERPLEEVDIYGDPRERADQILFNGHWLVPSHPHQLINPDTGRRWHHWRKWPPKGLHKARRRRT